MSRIRRRTREGGTVVLDDALRAELAGGVAASLIGPDDPGYGEARAIWNGMIQKRPALIVRVEDETSVADVVRFVRRHDLVFSVRSGGHNIAGTSLCDDGVVLDLSRLRGVRVDPGTGVVDVQAGCTLGDVDRETQKHGLAVPTGIVSETGIAGLTLGGGFGWLTRKHGYTSDNLLSARVVLPDGTSVTASRDENADLFWGIRGGGGNFGIVTGFRFQAHPVGPEVTAGMVVWPIDQAREVMAFYRDFVSSLPEAASTLIVVRPAPPAPFLAPEMHGKMIVGIAGMFAGPVEEGARIFAPVGAFGRPWGGVIAPKPFIAHQSMLDAGQPKGRQYYWKSEYVHALTEDVCEVILEHADGIGSPHNAILCFQVGGAMSRVPEDASAAGQRDAGFVVNVAGAWDDPAESQRHTAWVRACWEAVRPHGTGGNYVNFLTEDDGDERVRAAYGRNFDRLTELKARFDPDNVLRANQNIPPRVGAT